MDDPQSETVINRTVLISVIIPIYNVAQYLPECLDSVLGQTMSDFELLLIDDGSRDGSGAICDRYAARDARIRVFHTPNSGVSRARNTGLDHARGEFVVFVDSDDRIAPDRLQQLLDSGIGVDGIAFAGMTEMLPDGSRDLPMPARRRECDQAACACVVAELLRKVCFGWACCKMFSRTTIERHGLRFEECLFGEDEVFTAAYCRHITHISTDGRSTYFYRVLPESLLHASKSPEQLLETEMYVFLRYLELGYDGEVLHAKARMLLSRLKKILRHRQGALADWNSESTRRTVAALREVWKVYTATFRWRFIRDSGDLQYATLGRLIFTPRSDRWLRLMVRTLSI